MRRLNPLALLSLFLATTCFGAVPIYVEGFNSSTSLPALGYQRSDNWSTGQGFMTSTGPGDWANLSYAVTPKFIANRRAHGGIFLYWSTYLDSDSSGASWRELNKLWTELSTDSGTAYTFMFKPFKARDLATSVTGQFQVLYKDRNGLETPIAEAVHSFPTPNLRWIRFGVYIAPDSGSAANRILFFFNNGATSFQSVISTSDSRLKSFTGLGFRYRTGTGAANYKIRVDSIELAGVRPLPNYQGPTLPELMTVNYLKSNTRFGFIGEGELAFGRKFHGEAVIVNDNQNDGTPPFLKNLTPEWELADSATEAVEGNPYVYYRQKEPIVVRKIATLNARKDGLGTSIGSLSGKIIDMYKGRLAWHANPFDWTDRPRIDWFRPNVKELIKKDSAQIDNYLRRNAGKTLYWEICNEPNIFPVAISPEDYGRLYTTYVNFIERRTRGIYGFDSRAPKHVFAMGALFNVNLIHKNLRNDVSQLVFVANGLISLAVTSSLTSLGITVGSYFGPTGTVVGAVTGLVIGGWISRAQALALAETKGAVMGRMFGYTTEEYLRRAMVEAKKGVVARSPEVVSLHDYPFIAKSGQSRWDYFQTAKNTRNAMITHHRNTFSTHAASATAWKGPPKVWITEFGNINPNLEGSWGTDEAAILVRDMMLSYYQEMSDGVPLERCFYYKPLGIDEQFDWLPKGWLPKQALINNIKTTDQLRTIYSKGAQSKIDPLPCKALNSIGDAIYGWMNEGVPCKDYVTKWP